MTDDEVSELERLVRERRYEAAVVRLLDIVDGIERRAGGFATRAAAETPDGIEFDAADMANLERMAGAVTELYSDPGFQLNRDAVVRLIAANRWISAIYYVTTLRDSDRVITALASGDSTISGQNVFKFAALHCPQSGFDLPIDALHAADPELAISLALCFVATRLAPDAVAARRKEMLLSWLPERIAAIGTLEGLPVAILHEAMMNCSYATTTDKHRIKPELNRLLRRELRRQGIDDLGVLPPPRAKPVMAVVLDWWNTAHAMFRCYSRLVAACRPHFRMVAVSTYPASTDRDAMALFDDVIEFGNWPYDIPDELRRRLPAIAGLAPDVVYYPAIGMGLTGLFLSNLRLAPLQVATLGHPATPGTRFIDRVLPFPEFHGGDAAFEEELHLLPAGCVSFVPSPAALPEPWPEAPADEESEGRVNIAVSAYLLKLNPLFLGACKAIGDAARTPTRFHFFVGGGRGIAYLAARRAIRQFLPDAVVHPYRHYGAYTSRLARCAMFLSPFPFGNTNGIVDCVRLGIPGVCLFGEQPHAAIDRGMFRIAGLPEDLVAYSPAAYVAAAAGLADDAPRRAALRRELLGRDLDALLGTGRAEGFAETVIEIMGRRLSPGPSP